jgi:superfamily II RNA helicase
MSKQYKVYYLTGDAIPPANPVITFPYKPDNWQNHSFNATEKGDNVIVNVPTSGGKSTCMMYAIVHCVKILEKRAIVACPIKSLSNEKYNDFVELFTTYGISVGIMTGDNKVNPNAQVLLVTTEILHNSLYKREKKAENTRYDLPEDFVESIGCVVMDEIHYMNDKERGRVWETSIIMLPPSVQLIMLSGTIGNRDYFANWIANCRQKDVAIIHESKRIIPLRHFIYTNKRLFEYINTSEQYLSTNFNEAKKVFDELKKEREKKHKIYDERADILSMIHYLKDNDMLQAIVFSFSRRDCEKYASMIDNMDFLDLNEKKQVDFLFQKYIGSQRNDKGEYKFQNIVQVQEVKKLLERGIAYHHSTMLQNLRELIEIMMKKKLIKVLFATETLCIGVNVPAKTCIFTGLVKPTGKGRRNINTSEYRQMAGRAGRRGIDISGNVIFLPLRDFPYEEDFRAVVTGNIPDIKSNFQFDYQSILKLAQTTLNPILLFNKSLMNSENLDQVSVLQSKKQNLQEDLRILREKISLIIVDETIKETVRENINKLICVEEKLSRNSNLVLTKKQDQEQKALKALVFSTPESKELYNLTKKYNELCFKIEETDNKISIAQTYISRMYNNYRHVLEELGYVVQKEDKEDSQTPYIEKEQITIDGIICSQINDCNVFMLTEIITKNYFNSMTSEEIVAFLSIFTDPINKDSACGPHEFDGTDVIHNSIDKIIASIVKFQIVEAKYIPKDLCIDYTICTDYIDMAYHWGSGASVYDMTEYFQEYDVPPESFCKAMLKISNILQTVIGIYKMLGTNIEVIPKLEEANTNVLRDIVCTNSLYL